MNFLSFSGFLELFQIHTWARVWFLVTDEWGPEAESAAQWGNHAEKAYSTGALSLPLSDCWVPLTRMQPRGHDRSTLTEGSHLVGDSSTARRRTASPPIYGTSARETKLERKRTLR